MNSKNKDTERKSFQDADSASFTTEDLNYGLKSRIEFQQTWVDKVAAWMTNKFGSMSFLFINALFFLVWIVINLNLVPGIEAFDPFPFGFLTMVVSLVAIFLAIIVLISQNRQGRIADIRQQIDFEINVRAEHEITKILVMVSELHKQAGLETKKDPELEEMKETTNLEDVKKEVEDL